jgi:Papain-like cysteine protease AvrRpt2
MKPNPFRRLFVVVCLLAASLFSGSIHAQFPTPQPPAQPVILNVPVVLQDTDEWCWLASAEMILQYHGTSYEQCRIMEIGYRLPEGACCANANMCRVTGDWPQILAVLRMFGGVDGAVTGPLNPTALYYALSLGHPVIAKIRSGMTSMHAIVIRGIYFNYELVPDIYGRPTPQWVPHVMINDPTSFVPEDVYFAALARIWLGSLIAN